MNLNVRAQGIKKSPVETGDFVSVLLLRHSLGESLRSFFRTAVLTGCVVVAYLCEDFPHMVAYGAVVGKGCLGILNIMQGGISFIRSFLCHGGHATPSSPRGTYMYS